MNQTKRPIYLDYAATTPVDPRVFEAMKPYFMEVFGNPASTTHEYGKRAKAAVEKATEQICELIGCHTDEIIYTSGATESINLAIKGLLFHARGSGNHIITIKTEHKAVLDTCAHLEEIGASVTYLGVDEFGRVDLNELEAAIKSNTLMISVMWANNETGVLQDIHQIGQIARKNDVFFFSDATQAVGKIPTDVEAVNLDMMAFSGHKFYGPKGVGGLYVRKGVQLVPLIHGGGHQYGLRSGTLNVPGIVGLGEASRFALEEMDTNADKTRAMRDEFEEMMFREYRAMINGHREYRLPNISSMSFPEFFLEEILPKLNSKYSVALGSACNSAIIESSHVIREMDQERSDNVVRFSFGVADSFATLPVL